MPTPHLRAVLAMYYERWKDTYPPELRNTDEFYPAGNLNKAMKHAMWMCQQAIRFLDENQQVDKAHWWLGFIQGTLWACGHYTIDEMRAHSTEQTSP